MIFTVSSVCHVYFIQRAFWRIEKHIGRAKCFRMDKPDPLGCDEPLDYFAHLAWVVGKGSFSVKRLKGFNDPNLAPKNDQPDDHDEIEEAQGFKDVAALLSHTYFLPGKSGLLWMVSCALIVLPVQVPPRTRGVAGDDATALLLGVIR